MNEIVIIVIKWLVIILKFIVGISLLTEPSIAYNILGFILVTISIYNILDSYE